VAIVTEPKPSAEPTDAASSAAETPRLTGARAVIAHLRERRPLMQRTAEARHQFIRAAGPLIEAVRRGEADDFARRADTAGVEAVAVFRFVRERLGELVVPLPCSGCHESFVAWVDLLVVSAETMLHASKTDDPTRLREIESLFAEGRTFSARFKAQYEPLVNQIKERSAARKEQRGRLTRFLSGSKRGA